MQNSDFQLRKRATSLALSAGLFAICTGVAWGQTINNPLPTTSVTQNQPKTSSSQQATQTTKILVLGDSLSAEYGLKRGLGWVTLLQTELDQGRLGPSTKGISNTKKFQIQNASISGETTAGGRSRLPDLLARFQPEIVIIELGGNDALRGLDLSMTETNLREMTRLSKKNKAKVLILGMQIPPNFGKAYAEKFSAIFSKLAQTERTELVPFFLEGIADDLKYFQADRIHPNEVAQERMMKNVSQVLKALL